MTTLYKRSYTYDASGNRLTMTVDGDVTTYTYDDVNRLTSELRPDGGVVSYTYDNVGNQTVKETPEGDTYTTYDAANQATLIEPPGGPVEMTYNAYYQRVRKENASGEVTKYLYDHQRLLAETDDFDVTTKSYTSRTQNTGGSGGGSDGYGDLISEYDPSALAQAYPDYDTQWNTRELTDDSGDITASYRNTAFGLVSPEAQADWCSMSTDQWSDLSVDGWEALPVCDPKGPFGYGGQAGYYRDEELETYLMGMGGRGRYYDPTIGRFTTQDPSGIAGGDLNLYRYVKNNPVNSVDPSGNQTAEENLTLSELQRRRGITNIKCYDHHSKPAEDFSDFDLKAYMSADSKSSIDIAISKIQSTKNTRDRAIIGKEKMEPPESLSLLIDPLNDPAYREYLLTAPALHGRDFVHYNRLQDQLRGSNGLIGWNHGTANCIGGVGRRARVAPFDPDVFDGVVDFGSFVYSGGKWGLQYTHGLKRNIESLPSDIWSSVHSTKDLVDGVVGHVGEEAYVNVRYQISNIIDSNSHETWNWDSRRLQLVQDRHDGLENAAEGAKASAVQIWESLASGDPYAWADATFEVVVGAGFKAVPVRPVRPVSPHVPSTNHLVDAGETLAKPVDSLQAAAMKKLADESAFVNTVYDDMIEFIRKNDGNEKALNKATAISRSKFDDIITDPFINIKRTPNAMSGVTILNDTRTFKITNIDAYIGDLKKLYGKDNPLNPRMEAAIRKFIDNSDKVFSTDHGAPGLHAEVLAVNNLLNKMAAKGININDPLVLRQAVVATFKLHKGVGTSRRGGPFIACDHCAGILDFVTILTD